MKDNFNYTKGSVYSSFEKGIKQKIHDSFKKPYDHLGSIINMVVELSNQIGKGDRGTNLTKAREDDVSILCSQLYQNFIDIKSDFLSQKISTDQYKMYLNIFKALIDANLKLDGEKLHEVEIIQELMRCKLI